MRDSWGRALLAVVLCVAGGAAQANLPSGQHDELRCLALNIYHEARGEPEAGRYAVAAVTMNRVRSSRFPNSVCAVVWQPGQFSWTHDGRSDRPHNLKAWRNALAIAARVYARENVSPVGDATFFHTATVQPGWASAQRRVARVGRHIFYK